MLGRNKNGILKATAKGIVKVGCRFRSLRNLFETIYFESMNPVPQLCGHHRSFHVCG